MHMMSRVNHDQPLTAAGLNDLLNHKQDVFEFSNFLDVRINPTQYKESRIQSENFDVITNASIKEISR